MEAVEGLRHTTIPPRAHTWPSEVETAQRLIEDEFSEVERCRWRADFVAKARASNQWFKVARRNSGKEHQTPWELIHEKEAKVSAAVCALPLVFLDELLMRKLDAKLLWGYDVIPHPLRARVSLLLGPRLEIHPGEVSDMGESVPGRFCAKLCLRKDNCPNGGRKEEAGLTSRLSSSHSLV